MSSSAALSRTNAKPTNAANVSPTTLPGKNAIERRYRLRSSLNIAASVIFTALYAFIVCATAIYYFWFILSVFALDWAHAGTAVVEVAAIASRCMAPRTAMEIMWHSERSWAGPIGWMKAATVATGTYVAALTHSRSKRNRASLPAGLWWALTVINVPLWIAVPLSGLSFDFGRASVIDARSAKIIGVNQTTFETRYSPFLWQTAMERWSQSKDLSPSRKTVLYAPVDERLLNYTYYDAALQGLGSDESLTFFSGPTVDGQVEGRTWGLRVEAKVKPVHPQNLTMITASSYRSWDSDMPGLFSRVKHMELDPTYGCGSTLLIASDGNEHPAYTKPGGYTTGLPETTKVELIMWQYYSDLLTTIVDPEVEAMRRSTYVMHEPFSNLGKAGVMTSGATFNDQSMPLLSFGLSVEIESSVGFADVSAKSATFANFEIAHSELQWNGRTFSEAFERMSKWCNDLASSSEDNEEEHTLDRCKRQMQLNAIIAQEVSNTKNTLIELGKGRILSVGDMLFGALTCHDPNSESDPIGSNPGHRSSCLHPWLAANAATGGTPYQVYEKMAVGVTGSGDLEYLDVPLPVLRMPAISPERMRYAILKLVGELAVAMTGAAPSPHTGGLRGVSEVTILMPGVIPWQFILSLLLLWTVLFTGATCVFFNDSRLAPTLGAYQLFQFGAEWRDQLTDRKTADFTLSRSLEQVPSAGELRNAANHGAYGFVGVTLQKQAQRLP